MKKILSVALLIVLAVAAIFYLFREPIKQAVYARLTADMFVAQDTDDFDPGPAIGSHFPGLRARYQGAELTLLDQLAGAKGTVLVASRSLDWCPYCMKQIIQLQQHKQSYDSAGIGLAAITYDDPDLQQRFIDQYGITIPVLSDIDALSFKTLGILNDKYPPGDARYGIPHPGMIIIDPRGIVVGKLFIEAYSSRVDAAAALDFAQQALNPD